MKAVPLLLLSLGACAQITGVQDAQHRTLASCAGTFRAIGQVTTTAQPEFAESSAFLEEAAVFRDALSGVNQSLPPAEQDSLAALEERSFAQGVIAWDGERGRGASDLTVLNRLEFQRIQRRCQAALNAS